MKRSFYDGIIRDLKDQGFRLTKVRMAIIEELDRAKKPLSAGELIGLLKKRGLGPHKTSVYREIAFMLEQEIINRLSFGERQDRFELAALEHHHHAICKVCGEIEDIACSEGIRQIEEMLGKQKFKVSGHLIEFFGLCTSCQQSS
ncbi:MAG: transcriptional repressor [Actinobacteria bacterium]|nr:transcriptional repressor [Actinomycetota bacterium]